MDNATVAVLAVINGIGNDVHRLLGHIAIGFAVHSRLLGHNAFISPSVGLLIASSTILCAAVDVKYILCRCAGVGVELGVGVWMCGCGCLCLCAQANTCRPLLSLSLSLSLCLSFSLSLSLSVSVCAGVLIHLCVYSVYSGAFHDAIDS